MQILAALVEGNSIRSTVRITGAAKNTVVKLLRDAGRACEQIPQQHQAGIKKALALQEEMENEKVTEERREQNVQMVEKQ